VYTLIIGDSNMRMAKTVPAGWQLVVLPGAKCRHVIEMVERTCRSDQRRVETIYLQVGINHRDDVGLAEAEFRETFRQLRKIAVKVRYVGISYDRRLPGRVRDHIQDMNRMWRNISDGYVYPLEYRDVRIQDDRFGIHHDRDTVQRVMGSIIDFHSAHPVASSGGGVMAESQRRKKEDDDAGW